MQGPREALALGTGEGIALVPAGGTGAMAHFLEEGMRPTDIKPL
jgi:hypothetical protein